jgi:hypothetical protein
MTPVAGLDADTVLALGSAFKLYILGELAARVADGRASWEQAIPYDSSLGAEGSALQHWPNGAPLTLHSVATLMISRSDNTCTDLLLRWLGRESVESRLRSMGNTVIEGNVPFLATNEAFKLKSSLATPLRIAYVAGDTARRRALLGSLDTVVAGEGLRSAPMAIESIEWFASARQMCAAMESLRLEIARDSVIGGILAVNPGLHVSRERWDFVGYKGGSEPGVLNMTYLLKARGGQWYAMSAGWNNPVAALDEDRFFAILQRILDTGPWE